jgi:hypothetical protein
VERSDTHHIGALLPATGSREPAPGVFATI